MYMIHIHMFFDTNNNIYWNVYIMYENTILPENIRKGETHTTCNDGTSALLQGVLTLCPQHQ
jgi:hypothetical protein